MGENSKIEWCHHTFNPWWGCVEKSPACDNCYARTLANRYGFQVWGQHAERRFFPYLDEVGRVTNHWSQLLRWNKAAKAAGERRRVFCGSMCDIGDLGAAYDEQRALLFPLVEQCDWLDFLFLTKVPQNFVKILPAEWLDNPRPNVWGITTVESQEYAWRVAELLKTPFAIRGLSCEPLLGRLDLSRYLRRNSLCDPCGHSGFLSCDHERGIDWVITGGESGPGARPSHPDWFRSLRDQCVSAGVPFFFKQWGEYGQTYNRSYYSPPSHREPASAYSWGGGVYSPRLGKSKAGRQLDDREWNEFPEVKHA